MNCATARSTLRSLVHMKRPLRFLLGHGLSRTACREKGGGVTFWKLRAVLKARVKMFSGVHVTCDLVVVSIGDGVGVHTSLLHLNQDSHGHDRKSPQATKLHHNSVAHLWNNFNFTCGQRL